MVRLNVKSDHVNGQNKKKAPILACGPEDTKVSEPIVESSSQPAAEAPALTSSSSVQAEEESPSYLINRSKLLKFMYDKVGNRLSLEDDWGTIGYTYDEADHMLSAGETSYSYDDNGNQISQNGPNGETQYAYNADNQLTEVTLDDSAMCPMAMMR